MFQPSVQPSSESPQQSELPFPQVSRRTLLKLAGVGAGVSLLGYSRFSKPQPTVHQPDRLTLPYRLSSPKTAVVIGGGLAGLASAYELSQRGFAVTLLERSPQLGGKIASWTIQVGDEQFRMEHGFHGFFPQYYNLKSLVSELGAEDNFVDLKSYSVVFKQQYQPEVFRPSHSAFPWNIVDLAISSPNRLQWGINLTHPKHWQVFRAISGFNAQKSYQQLDHLSVSDWVADDFPQGLYDLYFLPFAKSSLNAPDLMSAAELMQFFHFYFFGNPEGLAFNGTKQDMGTSLVEPMAQAILANGGQIITSASVSQIDCAENQIQSVQYETGNAASAVPFWVTPNPLFAPISAALPENSSSPYYGAGDQMYAVTANGEEAISLTCTHQGCTVQPQADGLFHCPCHGAIFDAEGRVVKAPAERDLPRFKILQRQDEQIQLAGTASVPSPTGQTAQTLEADYYVIATDVPGVQQLSTRMVGAPVALQQQIEGLAIADPFAVCRFWFDRDFDWTHSDFTSLSGYQLTDSITLYHRIQAQFIEWAGRTGGSVVELHAYCYKEKEFPTQADLLATFERELYEIVPDLRQAELLHRELVNQKNFSGYPPNSYAARPETSSAIGNLLFAGDWVKMPFPCGLMERAVSSGLLAANEALHREGLQRRPILSVNPEGILQI
ncbi:MAG: FAD-dependent oxidoreductase [Pegethrix bostrychoides GSE-TBD4-15B]|uniref:FAD-dependent oxidoreductase n=1 Tax=Pegethrix bostrychoides GSE-TBD4-15B TaxID=2839662 RepID=A0A951U3B3_9CYAN|nr:FAD-dependent oxidoreductase [Pegethrix bostrychoides GSE-TBD4-15B]